MIDRLIELSFKHRLIVILIYVVIAISGYLALKSTSVDAIPDLSEKQVIVFTEWSGWGPQEVEDQITYPLTVSLQGLPGVQTIRSSSAFGVSMVNIIYEEDVDLSTARTRVLEKLSAASGVLPEGVVPALGPDATGLGQVYWYTVDGPYDPATLRSLQDWFIRYQLNSVSGVAEVASIGGFVREYQIDLNPVKLREYNISIRSILEAVQRSNNNVGAKVIESNDREFVVRGLGLIQSVDDIEKITVGDFNGTPIPVRNVAAVQIGPAFRRGVLDKNGIDAVGGVVVIRNGANIQEVIQDVKARIASIQSGLPPGVKIVSFYDRSELIGHAINSLRDSLIEEVILVTLAHVIFLWHFRSIVVVTLPLLLSVLATFLMMHFFGISSNIMSLGGIAIAIGVLVDASIVMTENVLRRVEGQNIDRSRIVVHVQNAVRLVGRPIVLCMAIIIVAFIPVFALTGTEGRLFHPLAYTKTFAMAAATLIAMTLVPVLCTFFIRGRPHPEETITVMRFFRACYRPVLTFALDHRKSVLCAAFGMFAFALYLLTTIGSEFIPPLDEESVLWMPVADPGISLTKATELLREQDRIIAEDPAVKMVVGKIGRADTSTDPAPINMSETIISLKPSNELPHGTTTGVILNRLEEKLRTPGIAGIWTKPIQNRIDMLSTGVRTQVGVKVFGTDLKIIEEKSAEIERVLEKVPGATDLYAERITSTPYLEFAIKRDALQRLGINSGDVQDVIETAIGGKQVTSFIQGRERYPVRVRYARDFREDIDGLRDVLVSRAAGGPVPLGTVTEIQVKAGPSMISSENGLLRGTVLMNVRSRDIGGFVDEAKRVVAQGVKMPPGYYLEWSGQYEQQLRAEHRLKIIIPIVLMIILALLCLIYRSIGEALLVMLAVPFALTGGVFLLKVLNYNLSVAVWVGFITLFGTAVQTGVVMVIYLAEAVQRKTGVNGTLTKATLREAVIEGALLRLRPKIMTVTTIIAGLLPIMWSTRVGSDVMKPLAVPVLGGMLSSLVHVLIITPLVFSWLRERELR